MRNIIILFCFILVSNSLDAQETFWQDDLIVPGEARHHPVTFSIGDYGYLVTGATENQYLKDFYKFDPQLQNWEQMEDFPGKARGFSYGVEYNGKGYIGFGVAPGRDYLNDLWVYDPETNEWNELESCPCSGRAHPAFVQTNGKIFIGAGNNASGDLKDFWMYDIETDKWTELPDFPGTERHHPYYFGIGSDVFIGFGHHSQEIYNDLYKYDTEQNEWNRMADLPGEGRVAGTQFSYNGKGYILSGQGEDHKNMTTGEFWEYDPQYDQWTFLPPHPGSSRWAPGSFLINNTLYFMSGESDDGLESTMLTYELDPLASLKDMYISINGENLYPNPASNKIKIDLLNIEISDEIQYQIYNLRSDIVLSGSFFRTSEVEVGSLQVGNYWIILNGRQKRLTGKFQIKR